MQLNFGSQFQSPGAGYGSIGYAAPTAPAPGTPIVPAAAIPELPSMDGASPGATGAGLNPVPGQQGWFGKIGGMEGIGSILSGIGSVGQIWGAMQAMKLAREQFDFSKDAYQTNLQNSTQSYNTSLEDRIRARYATEGRGTADVDKYLAKHSL